MDDGRLSRLPATAFEHWTPDGIMYLVPRSGRATPVSIDLGILEFLSYL